MQVRYNERAARRPGVWPPAGASASSRVLGGFKAAAIASSTRSSQTKRTCARAASGTSSRSFWLRAGKSTVVMPARAAASTFSFTPPMGSTSPRSEISPVIAVSLRAVRPVSNEASATNMATPALGPSLGMAPAGTWMCTSDFSNRVTSKPRSGARLRQRERRLRAFPHHLAELAGKDELAAARNPRRLDEQDVAPGRRPGKPSGDAGHARAHRHLVLETPRPENDGQRGAIDAHALDPALGDAHGDMAADRTDQPLQIANARFARVVADDRPDGVLGDLALLRGQAVRFELALEQIAPGDFELFVLGVSGQLDDLHAVAHGAGNGIEHVGGRDEHHL